MRTLSIAPLPFTASAGAHAYKNCSGGFNPDGSVGSFYRQIKAHNVGCSEARSRVVRFYGHP